MLKREITGWSVSAVSPEVGSCWALGSIAVGPETAPQTLPHVDAGSEQQAGTKQNTNMSPNLVLHDTVQTVGIIHEG